MRGLARARHTGGVPTAGQAADRWPAHARHRTPANVREQEVPARSMNTPHGELTAPSPFLRPADSTGGLWPTTALARHGARAARSDRILANGSRQRTPRCRARL